MYYLISRFYRLYNLPIIFIKSSSSSSSSSFYSTPSESYSKLIATGELTVDDSQKSVLPKLDELQLNLMNSLQINKKPKSFFHLFSSSKTSMTKGIYLYGSVGCGKTMLMDLFFSSLIQFNKKERIHFHAFMMQVHNKIHEVRSNAPRIGRGEQSQAFDPIPPVAQWISSKNSLLCLDELQVTDIADAMILKRLFQELFRNGIVVVATSNRHPDDLYKNGLQRVNFLPFISLIKETCDLVNLDSGKDYRRLGVNKGSLYAIVDEKGNHNRHLDDQYKLLCHHENAVPGKKILTVYGRPIIVPRSCGGVADFFFSELCDAPLSAADYLCLAEYFHTIIIRDVPYISWSQRSALRRFVNLIDTFYDNSVRLIISAADQPDNLFVIESKQQNDPLHNEHNRMLMDDLGLKANCSTTSQMSLFTGEEEMFAIDRAKSRLSEMQTLEYWKTASIYRKTPDYQIYSNE